MLFSITQQPSSPLLPLPLSVISWLFELRFVIHIPQRKLIHLYTHPLPLHSPNLPLQLPITSPSTVGSHVVQVCNTQHLFTLIIADPAANCHSVQRDIGDTLLYAEDGDVGKRVHVGEITTAGGKQGGGSSSELKVC